MDPKSLSTTAFCGIKIDNVTNNNTKSFILKDLSLKTGMKYNTNYAKVFNLKFSRNLNNPHIICVKTHGNPYFLFCTQINGVNYSLLIDKKVKTGYDFPKMFVLHYKFSQDIYNGTLIECELLKDNHENWSLIMADIYTYKGTSMKTTIVHDRINIIYSILSNDYIIGGEGEDNGSGGEGEGDGSPHCDFSKVCPIFVKAYFDYCDYKEKLLQDFIPELNYKCRGVYFVPLNPKYSKILYIFNDDDIKGIYTERKKNKNGSLIRFKIVKTLKPDIYDLYIKEKDTLKKYGIACVPTMKSSKILRKIFIEGGEEETIVVECSYNKRFEKWEPTKRIEGGNVSDIKLMD